MAATKRDISATLENGGVLDDGSLQIWERRTPAFVETVDITIPINRFCSLLSVYLVELDGMAFTSDVLIYKVSLDTNTQILIDRFDFSSYNAVSASRLFRSAPELFWPGDKLVIRAVAGASDAHYYEARVEFGSGL